MAITTIPWNDGSGDKIYVSAPSQTGSQTVTVSSDENKGSSDRTKTVTFTATANGKTVTKILTLIQAKVAEQYIVFADPVVEAICATNWGDGTGITPSQAARPTSLGANFKNVAFTSFNELRYFTGVQLTQDVFSGSTVEEFTMPENNKNFASYSMRNLGTLKTIRFGEWMGKISGNTFNASTNQLKHIHIKDIAQWINAQYGTHQIAAYPFNGSQDGHLYINGTEVTAVVIPSGVTAIPPGCFYQCRGITSVSFPASVTTINRNAFYYCNALAGTLTIPDTVTTLATYCFYYCSGLTTVDIGAGCTNIGAYAFQYVGSAASKCTFIVRATTPPTLGNPNAFYPAVGINKIYVPNGCLSAYQSAPNWNNSNLMPYYDELNPDGTIPT